MMAEHQAAPHRMPASPVKAVLRAMRSPVVGTAAQAAGARHEGRTPGASSLIVGTTAQAAGARRDG